MSSAENERLILRWFEEVWNQRRTATIDELMSPNIVLHGWVPEMGMAGFKQMHSDFLAAIPDLHITMELVLSDRDLVVAYNRVEGRQTGELFGIPPRKSFVTFFGTSIARVRDGKFVEAWDQYNFLELYGQLDGLEHISALRKAART